MVEEHDFLVYHLGSGPKFVKHAFERSCALAYPPDEESLALERAHQEGEHATPRSSTSRRKYLGLRQTQQDRLFDEKVGPSLCLATRIGPMHTAAAYTNLTSLLLEKRQSLVGKSILLFSYGSGAASTMYRLKARGLPVTNWDKHAELDGRTYHSAAAFDALSERYASTWRKFGWTAAVEDEQPGGAYYLTECDTLGRRAYRLVKHPDMHLQGPLSIAIEDSRLSKEERALTKEGPRFDWRRVKPAEAKPPPSKQPQPPKPPKEGKKQSSKQQPPKHKQAPAPAAAPAAGGAPAAPAHDKEALAALLSALQTQAEAAA